MRFDLSISLNLARIPPSVIHRFQATDIGKTRSRFIASGSDTHCGTHCSPIEKVNSPTITNFKSRGSRSVSLGVLRESKLHHCNCSKFRFTPRMLVVQLVVSHRHRHHHPHPKSLFSGDLHISRSRLSYCTDYTKY